MDDYQKEIADLERQLEQLVEEEGDKEVIADLAMQLEILKALYARVVELFRDGEHDPDLRHALTQRRVARIGVEHRRQGSRNRV